MTLSCSVKRPRACFDRSAVWWVWWHGRDVRGVPFCKRVGTLRVLVNGRWKFRPGRPGWFPAWEGERKRDVLSMLRAMALDMYSDEVIS